MAINSLLFLKYYRGELYRIARWIDFHLERDTIQRAIKNAQKEIKVCRIRSGERYLNDVFMGPTSAFETGSAGKKILGRLQAIFPVAKEITPGLHLAMLVHTYCKGRDFLHEREKSFLPLIHVAVQELRAYRQSKILLKNYLFAGFSGMLENSRFHQKPFSDWGWDQDIGTDYAKPFVRMNVHRRIGF